VTAKTRRPAIADSHDIVVMGSGHNEWVAAAYLAKAGKRVLILERQEFASGGVVTREINTPGVFIIRTTRSPLGHWPTPELGQYPGRGPTGSIWYGRLCIPAAARMAPGGRPRS
jgi:glycine/D-amino acid oxidase-like deaminating enzyme